jgi:hypothetical protein
VYNVNYTTNENGYLYTKQTQFIRKESNDIKERTLIVLLQTKTYRK